MALANSEALILQCRELGEQDKLVTYFSRDRGLMKGVAKGARKFGSRFGSSLEPMSHVKIFIYEKERRDLVTISNCDLIESFFEIQKDLKSTFTLSYFAELTGELFPLYTSEDNLFRLLITTLQAIKKGGDISFLSAYFETWILKFSGLLPDFTRCRKCRSAVRENSWLAPNKDGALCSRCASRKQEMWSPDLNEILIWIKKNPPPPNPVENFTEETVERLRRILQNILVFHLEREPKSLRFLRETGR